MNSSQTCMGRTGSCRSSLCECPHQPLKWLSSAGSPLNRHRPRSGIPIEMPSLDRSPPCIQWRCMRRCLAFPARLEGGPCRAPGPCKAPGPWPKINAGTGPSSFLQGKHGGPGKAKSESCVRIGRPCLCAFLRHRYPPIRVDLCWTTLVLGSQMPIKGRLQVTTRNSPNIDRPYPRSSLSGIYRSFGI